MVSFALLLNPSTTPLESSPFALNQFIRRGRCLRKVLAIFFIGSILDLIVLVHQESRNLPAW